MGMGVGVKMVGNRKVLSFVTYRVQMLYEMVPNSTLGLTDVEEATSGAMDTIDQVGRCTCEPLLDMTGLLWALNGGEVRDGMLGARELDVLEDVGVGGVPDIGGEFLDWGEKDRVKTRGLAIGTCMCPSYACLFVGYVKQSLFCCFTGTIHHLFLRYIDDCIGAASCSHKELEQFINFMNVFHCNLKFTWAISDTSLLFLDLSDSTSVKCLNTDIYFKLTDSRSYLDYDTSHPPSCKNTS
eukprot:g29618.t1